MLRPVSLLPALVAVATLAGGVVALSGTSATAAAPTQDVTPLAVTIESLSPSTVPGKGDGPVRVSGTVTNVDDQTRAGVTLYAFMSDTPITTPEELTEAADTSADSPVGDRILDDGTYDRVGDLEPGESARYSLRVPRSSIDVTAAGVYWFGVHALDGSDNLADGRARTFLPLVPRGTDPLDTALVVPIRREVRHAADGRIAGVPSWTRTLSPDGHLRSLVDFGAAAGSRPVTWLVDPAVVDTAESLAAGNPPRSLESTIDPGSGDDPEESGSPDPSATDEPSDESSESGSSDAQEDPSDEAGARERAEAAEAGSTWLEQLHAALVGSEILSLPFGNVDVDGAADHSPQLYRDARKRSGTELAPWGLATSPVVAPPNGYIDPAGIGLTESATTILTTDRMFRGSAATLNRVDGHTLVATSSGAVAGGPGPDDPLAPVALRQRIISDAAIRALSPDHQPLVVVLPPSWSPSSPSDFFDGLDLDWLHLTTVDDVTRRIPHDVDAESLDYPDDQADLEIDGAGFTAASNLIRSGDTLQNLLTLNDEVGGTVRDEAYTDVSYAAREQPWLAQISADRSRSWIEQRLRSVRVNAPKAVILSSGSGRFSATVTNDLEQPVTVKLDAIADPPLKVLVPTDSVDIAPKGRSTILLDASSSAVGVRNVTLLLTDSNDVPLGSSDDLPIRSNRVSNVIWLILGTGIALLFGAIAVRLFRRIRAAARS